MTDYFELLSQPRRPWLEPDTLKAKFLSLSSQAHPDRVHQLGEAERLAAQQSYAEINAAYQCLQDPKERLRHFLELETGQKPAQIEQVPPDLVERFFQVSRACRDADALTTEKRAATSALMRAQLFESEQQCVEKLTALQKQVQGWRQHVLNEVKALDAEWVAKDSSKPCPALPRLEELYRLLSYLGRWSSQLQERVVQLSF